MSLRIIERQIMARQAREAEKAKATPVAEGLAAALQGEIDRSVKAAVEAALAGQQKALRASSAMQLVHAPSPDLERRLEALEGRAVKALPLLQFERDGAGLLRAANIGSKRFLVQRDAHGSVVRLVPDDGTHAPTTYNGKPVPPASINRR